MVRDVLYIVGGLTAFLLLITIGLLAYYAGQSATKQAQLEIQVQALNRTVADLQRDQMTMISAFSEELEKRDLAIYAMRDQLAQVTQTLAATQGAIEKIVDAIQRYQSQPSQQYASSYYGGSGYAQDSYSYSSQTVATSGSCWQVSVGYSQIVVCQNW